MQVASKEMKFFVIKCYKAQIIITYLNSIEEDSHNLTTIQKGGGVNLVSVEKTKTVIIQMTLQISQAQGKPILGHLCCFNHTIIGLKEGCVQKLKTQRDVFI